MTKDTLRNTKIPTTDPQAGLKLTEIFYSLQGEALTAGLPTIFIRLTGCPLRCHYCDTTYSFSGGEPLAQPNAIALMHKLIQSGYEVSLETAGALSVANVPPLVSKVMDLKSPSSGEADKNLWENLAHLTLHDQIKIVIANRTDYEWAKNIITKHALDDKVGTIWLSPMFNIQENTSHAPKLATDLAEWILKDALPVRFGLQLHKIIWADAKGK